MAVRILVYVGLLWNDLIKAGAVKPGDPLPPVLPVVLYNGADPWTAGTRLEALMAADLPAALQQWQPRGSYLLLEERSYAAEDLVGLRNLAAALFRLEQSKGPEDIERVVAALIEWLQDPAQASLRQAFVTWLKRILIPARVPGADLPNVIELQELHAMLAERVKTWTEQWLQQGIERGRLEGRQEGRQEGESRLLRRLLRQRFSPLPAWVDERLDGACEAQLERWAERVLTCDRLEEVFAEAPGTTAPQADDDAT